MFKGLFYYLEPYLIIVYLPWFFEKEEKEAKKEGIPFSDLNAVRFYDCNQMQIWPEKSARARFPLHSQ